MPQIFPAKKLSTSVKRFHYRISKIRTIHRRGERDSLLKLGVEPSSFFVYFFFPDQSEKGGNAADGQNSNGGYDLARCPGRKGQCGLNCSIFRAGKFFCNFFFHFYFYGNPERAIALHRLRLAGEGFIFLTVRSVSALHRDGGMNFCDRIEKISKQCVRISVLQNSFDELFFSGFDL